MNISANNAESLIEIRNECEQLKAKIRDHLIRIDAPAALLSLDARPSLPLSLERSPDQEMLAAALHALASIEDSELVLKDIYARRRMSARELDPICKQIHLLSQRMERNIWEVRLTREQKSILNALLHSSASLCVWEDIPALLIGKTYDSLRNNMSGVVAFMHCYGVSFINYREGTACQEGWSLPLPLLIDAVHQGEISLDVGKSLIC